MSRQSHAIAGGLLAAFFGACLGPTEPSSESAFSISVAPLTLPGVSRVCYDLRVSNGPSASDPAVWSKGTPGLNLGTPDSGALCSTNFGNGAGGDLTFVGTCVASPTDAGQNYRTNSVTLWIDGVYDDSNSYVSPTGANGWKNPCPAPDGCTLTAACRENSDTSVEFNLTILREANQGFFDIGVNFEDIFCSAKVDCRDDGGLPLKLLFRPQSSTRDLTVVSALACTGGPGGDTVLYRDPLVLTCAGAPPVILDVRGRGNAWTSDAASTDAVFQYAIYAGQEALACGGVSCRKQYWNVAVGLDLANANACTLTSAMTASNGDFTSFTTPSASTYPYIAINLPITTTTSGVNSLACSTHELNAGAEVSTSYTSVSLPKSFSYDFDGTNFGNAAAPVDSDAQAFINATGLTNATQVKAINTLVTDLKAAGIWTRMKAVYPFVGGTAASHKYNLRDPRDSTAAFRLGFSGNWGHSTNGVQPDGSTAYADSFLNAQSVLTNNDNHISIYSRTDSNALHGDIGSSNSGSSTQIGIYARYLGKAVADSGTHTSTTRIDVETPDSLGFYISTRISSTSIKLFKNGAVLGQSSTPNVVPSLPSFNLTLGGYNVAGSVIQFSNRELAFATIGDGLSDTQAIALHTAVQRFQTTLGRQVGAPVN